MSFTFEIPCADPPPLALFDHPRLGPLAWVDPPEGDVLSPGSSRLYIEGRSTRGVEVTWEEGLLEVRILVGSSPEDFALARSIVHAAARRTGGWIWPEECPPIPVDELDAAYGARWAAAMVDAGARALRELVAEKGTITLIGPRRVFDMGGRIVRALNEAGPEETFPERFIAAVRRVQHLDPQRYSTPEGHALMIRGRRVTAELWKLSQGYLFPPVQYIHLHALDGRPLFLPYEVLPELPGVRAIWADERRLLVDPVPIEAWKELWAHAQQYHVSPTGERTD